MKCCIINLQSRAHYFYDENLNNLKKKSSSSYLNNDAKKKCFLMKPQTFDFSMRLCSATLAVNCNKATCFHIYNNQK